MTLTPRAKETSKNIWMELHQITMLMNNKETTKQMEEYTGKWYFQYGANIKICKKLMQPNSQKPNSPIIKWAEALSKTVWGFSKN